MAETTSGLSGRIVGRDAELAALDEFLGSAGPPRAFLLTGGPGIGKTTVWEAGVDLARRRGLRVLSARGSEAETRLSFTALIDLLDGIAPEELAAVPPPQLHALDVALLRAEPTGAPPEVHAIALGLLNVLRSLAVQEQLVVAIDDLHWLDRESGDVLAFAARRLGDEQITFLLARRPGPKTRIERELERRTLEHVVRPLTLGATRYILSEQLGLSLPRNVLRRVFETTLGNPLFVLEVGRVLAARGAPAIGEDLPVPEAVDDLLGTRVSQLPPRVRKVLLALALNADLRTSQLAAIGDPAALEEAVEAGVVTVDRDRVRPAHPLLVAAAKTRSQARERDALHLELANVTSDRELRALHLALATKVADDALAATVATAAEGASHRGARREAVQLGEHALRLTSTGSTERGDRLLALGSYLVDAGEPQRVTDLLGPEVETLRPGAPRVRAYMLLTHGMVSGNDEIQAFLARALAESGDEPALRAAVLADLAQIDAVIRVERIREAGARALEAVAAGGDVEESALHVLAWTRSLEGRPIEDLCERFLELSGTTSSPVLRWPQRIDGQRHTWRGEVGRAREVLAELLSVADERGESYSYVLLRLHMCELELRIGDCAAAQRLLDEWSESSERVLWPMYERCRALLAATRGNAAEAKRWAEKAVAAAEATGMTWDRLEALRAAGAAALLVHEPAAAAKSLRPVWEHTRREGVDDPGVFPVATDLVEALLQLNEPDEARAVISRLRGLSEEQAHPWGLATVARCEALVALAASSYDGDAAATLEQAATAYGELGLEFDRARTLLLLGRAQRRFRKWSAARDALERATAGLEEISSFGWAEQARSELSRVGSRKPQAAGELTPAEWNVAELATEGLANKEIAQKLFVTVRTVELHLSHVYAKLGIRSRTQLARSLPDRG